MQQLLEIMRILRSECPWDRVQTSQSLVPYAIEEAYEVEQAIQSGDLAHIQEELGDLLLQVVFQAQIYSEQGAFDFQSIVSTLADKLIRRHPHVFGDATADHEADVRALWQDIKSKEKAAKQCSVLDEVKPGPALNQAHALQHIAARLGFDWPSYQGALHQLKQEIIELEQAIATQQTQHIQAELGDCFFSLVNVARHLNQSSEIALLQTNHKFRRRFAFIEQALTASGRQIDQVELDELERLWHAAKSHEIEQHDT